MPTRLSLALVLLSVCSAILMISGCIFPDEDVTVDIYGADQINPNVTKPDGLRIRINNEVDEAFENMTVKMIVPENIIFKAAGLSVEKGLEWVYTFTTDLRVGGVGEYSFSYQPVVYEAQFGGGNEWSFDIDVQVYSAEGRSLGNVTTTWRVTR